MLNLILLFHLAKNTSSQLDCKKVHQCFNRNLQVLAIELHNSHQLDQTEIEKAVMDNTFSGARHTVDILLMAPQCLHVLAVCRSIHLQYSTLPLPHGSAMYQICIHSNELLKISPLKKNPLTAGLSNNLAVTGNLIHDLWLQLPSPYH